MTELNRERHLNMRDRGNDWTEWRGTHVLDVVWQVHDIHHFIQFMPERVQGGNKNMKLNKPIIKKVEFLAEDKACKTAAKLKPVLNWANVCSPNILRTLRRTMIHFLIELLVRRIWFGQSKLYFILKWLVMKCKLQPELAADSMIENVG